MATMIANELTAPRTRRPAETSSTRVEDLRSYGARTRATNRAARFERTVADRPQRRIQAAEIPSGRSTRARVDWSTQPAVRVDWRPQLVAAANTAAWGIAFGMLLLMVLLVVF